MARTHKTKTRRKSRSKPSFWARVKAWFWRQMRRLIWLLVIVTVLLLAWVTAYRYINPPGGIYMWHESRRLGGVQHDWVEMDEIAPVMARSAVAAEDANFCRHAGFDMRAIRAALSEGRGRGASTITQQVVKNTFLWHGRSMIRKGLEALLTPAVELIWGKRRILEVYLNIAEFDTGVFGVSAAARHHFGQNARDLTSEQSARLAAVLPAPQRRDAATPSARTRSRARAIADGAATIARDDRSRCFQG